jgi:hypothetical protein
MDGTGFAPAATTDKNLIDPWGVAFGPGPFWIVENNSGLWELWFWLSCLYRR